ncbi:DNA-directed RNA polymerase sigma-70 factor [Hallella multisaccharivorax DSM 17128]|uniref:RNA polymerase, sigma-24 subunit, ECF subfamily n=1 Tax=Hallella multisaccharivorax DSM 17128 TaxID=688246 RepID=F8N5W3_9BACT|nr:sigma-70 family RNA polymerase sigma factor [Hallella multisaccharivorax]EGN56125.1 RNA polymerase, sigma-24 subunit, ECF subfamily [Hallella multisaccharivorax DSM 17128]GJG29621.1 DNA-directed RNA polymerase sigma-70 factor [Hallella multisaccharivorax DSM 17128]
MQDTERSELYLISHGNEMAFDGFMERYSAKIFYHIFGILGDYELSEELSSDVFLEVWQHRKELPKIGNILGWINTIAFNKAVSALRKKRKKQNISLEEVPDFYFPELKSPIDGIISEEECRKLNKAIDALPPRCKHIFFLAKIEEMSYDEISQLLQISKATVNYHISFALSVLREKLRKAM